MKIENPWRKSLKPKANSLKRSAKIDKPEGTQISIIRNERKAITTNLREIKSIIKNNVSNFMSTSLTTYIKQFLKGIIWKKNVHRKNYIIRVSLYQ